MDVLLNAVNAMLRDSGDLDGVEVMRVIAINAAEELPPKKLEEGSDLQAQKRQITWKNWTGSSSLLQWMRYV